MAGAELDGCRVPKLWAVLYCSPGRQAGSWMRNRAAETETGIHKDPSKDLATRLHQQGPWLFSKLLPHLLPTRSASLPLSALLFTGYRDTNMATSAPHLASVPLLQAIKWEARGTVS